MKIKALAATVNKFPMVHDPDCSFTEENLKAMAESSAGVSISDNFDISKPSLGKVESGEVIDGQLFIYAELFRDQSLWDLFLVPGIYLPDYKAMSYGVTKTPSDNTLTAIQIID